MHRMAANYLDIRHSHYRITLRGWLKGLDKALIAIASALTFMLTAMVAMAIFGMAQALLLLLDPSASRAHHIVVIGAWQGFSFLLLRATREAALMPKVRFFFDSLPIAPSQKLRADAVLALLTYSFLWLPIAWVVLDPLGARNTPLPGTMSLLGELVVLSLCLNLTLLRSRPRHALLCGVALLMFAAPQGANFWMEISRAGSALLAVIALWASYQPGAARAPARPRRIEIFDRLAISSGLVLALLTHELRANLAVRCGAILATLAACLLVIELRTNDTSSASVLLFVVANGGPGVVFAARAAAPDADVEVAFSRRPAGFRTSHARRRVPGTDGFVLRRHGTGLDLRPLRPRGRRRRNFQRALPDGRRRHPGRAARHALDHALRHHDCGDRSRAIT